MEKNEFRAVIKHLYMIIEYKKVISKMGARLFIVDYKRDRVTISKQCLEMFQCNPDEFLRRFITVEETWIHYFRFPSKQTINDDYYATLLDRFNNILKKKRFHLAKNKVLFHQDNARVHMCPAPIKFNEFRYELLLHPAYSPDLAPCDFPIFKPEKMVRRKEIHHQRAAHRRNRGLF
ncbi:SETMR methyltransferase, partial [Acromyrmex insinuator]